MTVCHARLGVRWWSAVMWCVALLVALLTPAAHAQSLSVPLTVQEALYPGGPTDGISRTQEPVTVGIPIPDSARVSDITQLSLTGAAAGQFRVLGRWTPSNNIKWLLVDTLADVSAGGQNTGITLVSTGTGGNFGGSNLATDRGADIRVDTGTAQFVVKKAAFNLFNSVVVNGKTLVSAGTSQGLVIVGPVAGEVTCGTCTTEYTSSGDAASTAMIEENGPVRAVIKADGALKDSGGFAYMRFTVRMQFYKGRSHVKTTVVLRNADESSTGNDFPSAYKGFTSFEARIKPNLGAGKNFAFGNHQGTTTGAFAGAENAYLYQAYSNKSEDLDWQSVFVVPYIPRAAATGPYAQEGYVVRQGATTLQAGSRAQYPEGWADLKDASGAGVQVGVYNMAAYWPKSLQFQNGGTEVRVGVWPDQNLWTGTCDPGVATCQVPYYQSWPQYSVHDLFFNFHDSSLSAASDAYRRLEHYLVARASRDYYNQAGIFPYAIPDPTEEDNYYRAVDPAAGGVHCCISDMAPKAYRYKAWGNAGGTNQQEFRFANLMNWLQRGMTGRYLNAAHFYRMQVEQAFARSDGFSWRDHPVSQLDILGFPNRPSLNSTLAHRSYIDQEHPHWYGMMDYYFMSGDETIRDAIMDGPLDRFMNPNIVLAADSVGCPPGHGPGCYLWNERAVGGALMSSVRLYQFLKATGDAHADDSCAGSPNTCGPLNLADRLLAGTVFQDLQVSGFGSNPNFGISPVRGIPFQGHTYMDCGTDTHQRFNRVFMAGILGQGLYEMLKQHGPTWPDYNKLLDRAYGLAEYGINEAVHDGGTVAASGHYYSVVLDVPNSACNQPTASNTELWSFFFLAHEAEGGLRWKPKFDRMVQKLMSSMGLGPVWLDISTPPLQEAVYRALHPSSKLAAVNVALTVTNLGGGSYRLSWTPPPAVQSYRLKYVETGKNIVDWIGFDPDGNRFIGDPNTTWPWFSSLDAPVQPAPAANTITVTGFDPANARFALKAYIADRQPPTIAITAPPAGTTVSRVVTVSANAADDGVLNGVQFNLDGTALLPEMSIGPFVFAWDTTVIANGAHTLSATATDAAANQTTASININVFNDLSPPTVSITAPAAGATITGRTTLSATASDNVGVVGVVFKLDGVQIGAELTTPPYSLSWDSTAASNGTHTISATARDAYGNYTIRSVTISVFNDLVPPTVAITSHSPGVTVAGTVNLLAVASDNVRVAGVLFKVDGVQLGSEIPNPPYSITWNTLATTNAAHIVTAVARDTSGNTNSTSITLNVYNPPPATDTTPPTVAIASPQVGTVLSGTVVMLATASDNVGVAGVTFRVDGTQIGSEIRGTPYSASWNTTAVANGNHTLMAVARDAAGNVGTASAVFNVNNIVPPPPDTDTPVVAISSPVDHAQLAGVVTVAVSASDAVGVRGVSLQVDGAQLGAELANPPYSFSWNTVAVGDGAHTLTALARDTANHVGSASISVTVNNTPQSPDTTRPTVSITTPQAEASVSGMFLIAVTASDNVGVAGVSLAVDGQSIGSELTTPPFDLSWDSTAVTNGAHTLTATARDAAGNTATATVRFTVGNSAVAPGSMLGVRIDASTTFTVQLRDLGSLVACPTCWFQSASDVIPGQELDVVVRSGSNPPVADRVTLVQGAVAGTVQQAGTNQFVITVSGGLLPSPITVLTGTVTTMLEFGTGSLRVGQQVSVRGLLFKSGPQGGATMYARVVELQQ